MVETIRYVLKKNINLTGFKTISNSAKANLAQAKDNEVLALRIKINSPAELVEALPLTRENLVKIVQEQWDLFLKTLKQPDLPVLIFDHTIADRYVLEFYNGDSIAQTIGDCIVASGRFTAMHGIYLVQTADKAVHLLNKVHPARKLMVEIP